MEIDKSKKLDFSGFYKVNDMKPGQSKFNHIFSKKINSSKSEFNKNSESNKNSEIKSNNDSKDNSNKTNSTKNDNSSYLNSTPTGEDSTEIKEYYNKEQKEKTIEKEKEQKKIKESQKKYNEEQKDINKSFSFKDFKKSSKVSLENDGNVTYMNCVIQCLSNFKFMICYYLNNLNKIKNKLYKMPLSYALSRIIFHLNPYPQDNLQKSFSIASFHKVVSHENFFFSGNSEKDPNEFIVFLLDKLHEEDRKEMAQNNNNGTMTPMDSSKLFNYLNYLRENEHSIIFDNFCWINRTLKICSKCNSKFFNYQRFFTFYLKLDFENGNNGNNNNENSVKNFIEKQMNDKVLSAYCQGCKKKTDFKMKKSIIFFPNVFIIIIEKSDKNSQLNIDEEMKFGNEEEKIEYKLNGMIAYNALNECFKYIAYCLNSIDNKWYKYDDQNTVSSIDKKEFLNNNKRELTPTPNILFYQKK
jgi:ubiquitin C-terminal hydrolase